MSLNIYTVTTVRRPSTTFSQTFDFSLDLTSGEGIRAVGGLSQTRVVAVNSSGTLVPSIVVSTTITSQTIVVKFTLPAGDEVYHVTCYAEGATSGLVEPQTLRIAVDGLQPF